MAGIVTRKRFTADEYQRMGQVGILSEDDRVELIDGEIVAMTPIGTRHNACVAKGTRALVRAAGDDAIVLPQGSIRLDLYSEPQPDLVLLRPRSDFYASRHAGPGDILLVIEIAESSIQYDRDVKAPIYAAAGVPEYWLVDLNTDLLWRYSVPERRAYRNVEQYDRGQSVAPMLRPACVVDVDMFLLSKSEPRAVNDELMPALHLMLRHVRALAFDLDGTLYENDAPIPGAIETVSAVRAAGLSVRFVTNTTSISRRLIAARLQRLGFRVEVGELFCPARAAAAWLQRERASAAFFVPEPALEDFEGVARNHDRPDVVVIGDLESGWTFESMNRAFRLVHEQGARLVGLGRTRYWRGPRGLQLDVGPFLAALEYATGKAAVVFGKPEPEFFAGLLEELAEPAGRVGMIGDDIMSDVGAAMSAGLVGVLVRTGKFHPRDLERSIKPDLVIDSVAQVIDT